MTATRLTCGAISLSSSSHLPLKLYSNWGKPVMLLPGRASLSILPAPTGSMACANTIGTVRLTCCSGVTVAAGAGQDDVWVERDQFRRVLAQARGIAAAPSGIDPHVAADSPARLL